MKKLFLLAGILAAACTASVALSGCAVMDMSYANADKYTVGGGNVTGNVTELEIDWVDGNVEIVYGDVTEVTFSETSASELSTKHTLHYWLENTTLHIKFGQSAKNVSKNSYPKKDLKVILPASLTLNKLDLEAVNTDVKIDNVSVADVEIETTDGEVNAYLVGTTRELSVETVGGNITVKGEAINGFEVETVGAEVYLESVEAPRSGSFESMGGNLTLALYDNATGFTFEFETLGGKFQSDFETNKNGKRYTYGSGGGSYEAETTGGNVKIEKKTAN